MSKSKKSESKPAPKSPATAAPVAKPASTKKREPSKAAIRSAAAAPKEVDPETLDEKKAKKRLTRIYKLERDVENKRVAYELAKSARRSAMADLESAQEELQREIRDQRYGPGELYAGVSGSVFDDKPKTKPQDAAGESKGAET